MRFAHSLTLAALLAGASLSVSAVAECVYPKDPPAVPNGEKATEAEMISGKQAFNDYQTQMNAYLECLDKEADARIAEAGDNADQVKKVKGMTAERHNAAIDVL